MKNFNIKRFWQTFKWYFYENRGLILKWTASVALVTAILELLFVGLVSMSKPSEPGFSPYTLGLFAANSICVVLIMFSVLYINSYIFGWIKQKQKRIAFLTLPATNLERWTTATLYAAVIIPACIIAGYLVGDVVRNIVFYLPSKGWVFGFDAFTNMAGHYGGNTAILSKILNYVILIWTSTFFILGGTWFKKAQFIVITAIELALTLSLGFLAKVCDAPWLNLWSNQDGATGVVHLIILVAFSIFNLWLSYRIFKRFQIITSNWTNQ